MFLCAGFLQYIQETPLEVPFLLWQKSETSETSLNGMISSKINEAMCKLKTAETWQRKLHKNTKVSSVGTPLPESDPQPWSDDQGKPRATSSRHKHRSPFPTACTVVPTFNQLFSAPTQLYQERHLFWSHDASLSQICPYYSLLQFS